MLLRRYACFVRALAGLALVLALSSVLAASAPSYSGSEWALLDRAAVLTTAAEITPEAYPDSVDAIVDQKLVRAYHEDGTAESQDETYTKILTEPGRRNNTTLSLGFMLPYYTVDVVLVELIKPDGRVVTVDVVANSKESIDDGQMGANIYDPNCRVLRVNIPQLELGDIVHSVTRCTTVRPVVPGEYADENYFERGGYLHHASYIIHAPAGRPLRHIVLRDEVPGTIVATTARSPLGGITHRWEAKAVPRVFAEPSMPSGREVLQRVLVSTIADWPTLSRWYWQVCAPHLEAVTPEMKKMAQELVAAQTTERGRIEALFYFVSKNIRYMGVTPEKDRPGFEPHDVALTFGKRYGVCRDKAALLVALLRAAGCEAFPVLTNVGARVEPDIPGMGFNHAIVAVDSGTRDYLLMDPTDENTRQLLPGYESNQSFLVCRPAGEELRVSPIEPVERNMMRFATEATLASSGALTARTEVWCEGINDNTLRAAFIRMKPDERWRDAEAVLKRNVTGARLQSLRITPDDMRDTSASLHIQLEYTVDNAIVANGDKAVLIVPWLGNAWSVVNEFLGATGLEKRRFPLKTGMTCGTREDIALTLAPGFGAALSLPSSQPAELPTVSYARRFELDGRTLRCSRELKLKTVQFSADEYLELKRLMRDMQYDSRKVPVVAIEPKVVARVASVLPATPATTPSVDSDRRYLKAEEDYVVLDAHSQDRRVHYVHEILTEQGKKSDSEVKLHYNPAVETVRIVHAVVTSKSGQRQELGPDETHVMDAEWNASAKRYTGEKILVANLPGVEVGSTIDVTYDVTTRGKLFLWSFFGFQFRNALEEKRIQFTVPEGVATRTFERLDGIVKAETSTSNHSQVWRWSAEHVAPIPAENNTPPDWSFKPGVVTFVGDVDDYFRAVNAAFHERGAKSAHAAARARELAASAGTRLEAVRLIRDFVATAVRPAGPSFKNLPLAELSDADRTLADGYGHEADRAILLHAMLAAIGFQPEFVLASNLPEKTPPADFAQAFPIPGLFDQPIVTVALEGTTYVVRLDQYARLGSTWFDGRLAVRLSDRSYQTVRATEECRARQEIDTLLAFADDGKARLTVTLRYFGNEYGTKNAFFAEVTPEDRRRYFEGVVASVAQGARPVGELVTDFRGYPGIEQFTVEADRFAVVDGNYFYFENPVRYGLVSADAERRTQPVYLTDNATTRLRTEIKLPPAFRRVAIAPASDAFTVSGGAATGCSSTTLDGDRFVIAQDFARAPAVVPPTVFAELQAIEARLENRAAWFFLLERDTSAATKRSAAD